MALVVEDGSGVASANGLCSLAFADTYFTDRANAAWTGTEADKSSAIIRATDYIETRFGRRFIGSKMVDTQALSWPRDDADPAAEDEVPIEVQKACAEYAVRALSTTLAPDPSVATGAAVTSVRKVVGPIETETHYSESATIRTIKPYPAADMLLRPWLMPSSGVYR